jgi:hypothetical protein
MEPYQLTVTSLFTSTNGNASFGTKPVVAAV